MTDSTPEALASQDPWYWAFINKMRFQAGVYELAGHEYQVEPLQCEAQVTVDKKGSQMGFTQIEIIRDLHGLRYGRYPQGVLYLFPTDRDVSEFSKSRFAPLLEKNRATIGAFIRNTDSTNLKQIGDAFLFFRGARVTQKVEGMVKESTKLRAIPVDRVVYDEEDLMDPEMVEEAKDRMQHSTFKEESHISTPSIPDFGVDKHYQGSDQRVWTIKCKACGEWTCLELEFPECIGTRGDGTGYRMCRKCQREIYPKNGQWVAQFPGRKVVGRWISQLNSMYVDPGEILKDFLNPPNGNLQRIKNSRLGMAHIDAENRLRPFDLWPLMGADTFPLSHEGPTAMGVDVGNNFHYWILDRPNEKQSRIVKVGQATSGKMTDFKPLHDIIKQYNVRTCVIDFAPVQNEVRAFRESEDKCEIFGCIYQEHQRGPATWDVEDGIVRINRTEICDATHKLCTTPGKLLMPRRNPTMEEWVKQMCNIAKVLQEDQDTGSKEFHWRKLGPDHFFHAGNYGQLAASRIGIYVPKKDKGHWRGEDRGSWKSR